MDNPLKGEVGFDAAGQRWRMVFGPDAMAALEAHFDESMTEMSARISAHIRVGDLMAFIWAGLMKLHPEVTAEAVRGLVYEVGVGVMVDKVATAWRGAFSTEEEAPKPARPRKRAAAGTG
ncbi:MAG: gene transfer agent family protein [Caulobacterales bacterium]|nr:gene transfer agent family protein [Caulobacterales bacterium]